MNGTRFAAAFNEVLSHDLDRRLLLELRSAGQELRYEELRRRVAEPAPEAFSRAVERLGKAALVRRRLARLEGQRRFGTWLSPSSRGLTVATILDTLSSTGAIPTNLSKEVRTAVLQVFGGKPAREAQAVQEWRPIPNSIFLLGPDEWDDDISVRPTPRLGAYLPDPRAALTARALRRALATAIARESNGLRAGLVMGPQMMRQGESDADLFRRIELSSAIDAYFVILPTRTKVLGTVFEGGMLQRDFHYGRTPRIVLFLEEGIAGADHEGRWRFLTKGKRTRYLESLADSAEHVALWTDFDDLLDQVLAWAEVDD